MDQLLAGMSAKRVTAGLAVTVLTLAVCHVAVMTVHFQITELHWLFRDLFDLDEEQSFGTWVSAALLLFAGMLLLTHARDASSKRRYWGLLGGGFVVLSLDEVVGLHETLNTISDTSWTLPGAIAAGVAAAFFAPFLISLPARTRWLFMLAGAIYLGGALGVERATDWYADAGLLETLEYNLTTVVEETMEMSGVVILISALVSHRAETRLQAPQT